MQAFQLVARATQAFRRTSRRSRGNGRRLTFEWLEDRRVFATLTVTTLADAAVTGPNSAPGTLRQAIFDANASPDADVIEFTPDLAGSVQLSFVDDTLTGSSAFVIATPITIRGNANGILIAREETASEMRLFRVAAAAVFSLDTISLTGGVARGASGATEGEQGGLGQGGAILNQGTVQIANSTIYSNRAIGGDAGVGGHYGPAHGGAIYNDEGTVSVTNSTFSGNSVIGPNGGAVGTFGGAIYTKNGTVTIHNSTLTSSTALTGRALYVLARDGTAIIDIRSSILGQSDAQIAVREFLTAPDENGVLIVTGSDNLIRTQGDYHYITTSSDDPLLGPLSHHGGPTLTHALEVNSPAIDAGNNSTDLATDQRGAGFARVVGSRADIGAYEVQTTAAPAVPGDYNRDNIVDSADYVLWRKSLGATVPKFSGADGNGNGEVESGDYGIWRSHFGETPNSEASGQSVLAGNAATSDSEPDERIQATPQATPAVLFSAPAASSAPVAIAKRQLRYATSCATSSMQDSGQLLMTRSAHPRPQASDDVDQALWELPAGTKLEELQAKQAAFSEWPGVFMPEAG